jgi:hypothetical protein
LSPIIPDTPWEPIDTRPGKNPFEDDEEEEEIIEVEEEEERFGF